MYVCCFKLSFFMSSGGHRDVCVCVLPWGRVLCPLRAAAKSPLTPPELLERSGWFCFPCLAVLAPVMAGRLG